VDNHQPFVDVIAAWSEKEGYNGRVKTLNASMNALQFGKGQFDLIWSEGAIFIIGFETGLKAWKPLVKKGGFMVVSDAAWFEPEPPQELVQWWEKEGYVPGTEEQLSEQVKTAGLRLVATYRLPEAGGGIITTSQCLRIAEQRKTHGSDPACAALLDSLEYEAEMYGKYKRYYGYRFFIMQNP
jgi:hypothetical protein